MQRTHEQKTTRNLKNQNAFLESVRPLGVVTTAMLGALAFAGIFYGSIIYSDRLESRACDVARRHFTSFIGQAIVVPFTLGCELAQWLNEDPFEGAK